MDEPTIQLGLLMETAQTHQALAQAALEELKTHTRGLDQVVRDAVHNAFVQDLGVLHQELERAQQALRAAQRTRKSRGLVIGVLFGIAVTSAVAFAGLAATHAFLCSPASP
jgi:hypothetical protein